MARPPIGFYNLWPTWTQLAHRPDFSQNRALSNVNAHGTLTRMTSNLMDGFTNPFDLSYYIECVGLSDAAGKNTGFQTVCGQDMPPAFFAAHPEETLTIHIGKPPKPVTEVPTSVPFGPAFQAYSDAQQVAMAAEFDANPHVKYVLVQGPGNASESFLVTNATDEAAADQLAQDLGYSAAGGKSALWIAWVAGCKVLITSYMNRWANTLVVYGTGSPFPTGGQDAQAELVDWGHLTYGNRFMVRPNNLTHGSPKPDEPSVALLQTAGGIFQFGNHQNNKDPNVPDFLDQALQRMIDYGALGAELFDDDLNDPNSASTLVKFAKLLGITICNRKGVTMMA